MDRSKQVFSNSQLFWLNDNIQDKIVLLDKQISKLKEENKILSEKYEIAINEDIEQIKKEINKLKSIIFLSICISFILAVIGALI